MTARGELIIKPLHIRRLSSGHSLFWATVLLALLLAVGCRRAPSEVLSEDEMVSLLCDMLIAESYDQDPSVSRLPDSVRRRLGDAVLAAHDVDKVRFDSTLAWYGRNLDEYQALYAKVDKRLAKMLKERDVNVNREDEENLWTNQRHYWLTAETGDRSIIFVRQAEDIPRGSLLEWSMSMAAAPNADVLFGAEYTDGTSTMLRRTFRGDRKPQLTLATDTGRRLKRIFTTIHVDMMARPVWIDSLRLVKNPYDSTRYSLLNAQMHYYGALPRRKESADTIGDRRNVQWIETAPSSSAAPGSQNSGGPLPSSSKGPVVAKPVSATDKLQKLKHIPLKPSEKVDRGMQKR